MENNGGYTVNNVVELTEAGLRNVAKTNSVKIAKSKVSRFTKRSLLKLKTGKELYHEKIFIFHIDLFVFCGIF